MVKDSTNQNRAKSALSVLRHRGYFVHRIAPCRVCRSTTCGTEQLPGADPLPPMGCIRSVPGIVFGLAIPRAGHISPTPRRTGQADGGRKNQNRPLLRRHRGCRVGKSPVSARCSPRKHSGRGLNRNCRQRQNGRADLFPNVVPHLVRDRYHTGPQRRPQPLHRSQRPRLRWPRLA